MDWRWTTWEPRCWYMAFYVVMLTLARVYLVNPVLQALSKAR